MKNTYYWFTDQTYEMEGIKIGELITADTKISAPTGYALIGLNYSTNLVKSGVAIKVAGAKPH